MQTVVNSVLYGMIASFLYALTCFPRRLAYWLGARLGGLVYMLLAQRRRITQQNLALAFGSEKSPEEQRRMARATFHNLGRHLVDFSRLRQLNAAGFAQMCTVEGLDEVRALLARRAGLLVLSAHFGSWELAPAVALRLDTPLHVIVRPPDHPVVRRLVEAYRQRCGYHLIPKRQAFEASSQALRRGEMVAVLMDQSSLRREAVEVEFFGIKTYTPVGPALLALRTGCPVVSAFLVCEKPGQHRLLFGREIPIHRSGNLQADLEENTRRFNRVIEASIRRCPEHWFWLHRRWKERPV
jgi:KDO2-lipid IV(A) lauroyltransferase